MSANKSSICRASVAAQQSHQARVYALLRLGHARDSRSSAWLPRPHCAVAALSTTLSTAALDKHPQSKERGITLDLGFSSFTVPAPQAVREAGYPSVQFTLVDCPGHASLIRTVIGGAQIIDLMLLVVDITKGWWDGACLVRVPLEGLLQHDAGASPPSFCQAFLARQTAPHSCCCWGGQNRCDCS